MPATRREFLQYCVVCGAVLTLPDCCCRHYRPPCPPCPPPSLTPPRGVDPPHIIHPQLPPWPVDPQIEARKAHIRGIWLTQPKLLRQDGMWPYLLIRAFPGDHGARPTTPGTSPDIVVAEGFPAPPPTSPPLFCHLDSPWTIYVRVWNLGRLAALAVALRVYSAWSNDLSHNYQNFQLIGGTYLNLADKTQRSCEQLVQFPDPWVPRQTAASTAQSWALIAVASAATDMTGHSPPTLADLSQDRHVGSLFLDTKWSAREEGDLTTTDPTDRIHYLIEHAIVKTDLINIRLVSSASNLRLIGIIDATGAMVWDIFTDATHTTAADSVAASLILASDQKLTFEKEQQGGAVVKVLQLGDLDCLQGGDRVTFFWNAG
jgi:hypothetical protein